MYTLINASLIPSSLLASFPGLARLSLAVRNSHRRSGLVHHVICAAGHILMSVDNVCCVAEYMYKGMRLHLPGIGRKIFCTVGDFTPHLGLVSSVRAAGSNLRMVRLSIIRVRSTCGTYIRTLPFSLGTRPHKS